MQGLGDDREEPGHSLSELVGAVRREHPLSAEDREWLGAPAMGNEAPYVERVKSDTRIVTGFTIAGLLVPFCMFFVLRLATQEHPVLTLTWFNRMADILWPGRRFAYMGYIGPWDWGEVVRRFLKSESINALVYAAAGVIVVCGVRAARFFRNRPSVER